MPTQLLSTATLDSMPGGSLVLWTSVGLNEQSTRAGKELFRQSEYPIAWYIGLEYGEEENSFAKNFIKTIKSFDQKQAKVYESKNSEGRDIYGYFNDFETFKTVVEKVVGQKVLNVERFSGEVQPIDADILLRMGRDALDKFETEMNIKINRSH